jgi:hypothetical protein
MDDAGARVEFTKRPNTIYAGELTREAEVYDPRDMDIYTDYLERQELHDKARIAELEARLDFCGDILGKICVYGTMVSGERPADPPSHAAIDAILAQINRADRAEASLFRLEWIPIAPQSVVTIGCEVLRRGEVNFVSPLKPRPDPGVLIAQGFTHYRRINAPKVEVVQ